MRLPQVAPHRSQWVAIVGYSCSKNELKIMAFEPRPGVSWFNTRVHEYAFQLVLPKYPFAFFNEPWP